MKIRLFFLSLLSLCLTQAQGQDKDCAAKSKSIDSLVTANDFPGAFALWKTTRKCVSEPLFQSGEKILTHQLSTALSSSDKAEQSAMLLQLYSDYDLKFPGNSNGNAVKKAMFLYRQDQANPDIFTLLDRAFTKDRQHFNDARALQVYFDGFYKQALTQPDQTGAPFAIIRKRNEVLEQLTSLYAETKNKDYQTVATGIRKQAAPVANCENLDAYYTKEIDVAANNNAAWLQSSAENLAQDCPRSKMYYQIANKWYGIAPGPKAAFHLAQASIQQRKGTDANKYFAIAAEGESDANQKADIYYIMAMREIGNAPKAVDWLNQALKAKPDFGKAYLLMAEVYASTNCGNTEIEKKARYLLAAKTALKAASLDKALGKTAESQAAAYRKKAPTATEIKAAKMSGKTVNFGCGINESVTLP